ncbi:MULTISPECIES: MATE family efflux transporter [unclassified Fusibacter]|uniref:MATE family efflux transporter n=1 Tax=unclassified Fusibacter TaxID=2624464 RepID=UPI001012561F|nr:MULTISPECIES: MATE family efflux transporter [unclassified Fusibacter]MCK8060473.1 MATE family efflux transporter [Fusibacter sp. A2]NPE20238.1 MATE family efflux transporter [Fusibacter sp. A1]RXV63445.1 MATE family efflux transporter [Fusibacter sp. A1]
MENHKLSAVPIPKLILGMSIPVIFSMMVQALYNVVDSIFVSRVSEQALTAVSLAFPIQMIIVAAFVGLGTGINSNISRRLGEGNREEAISVSEHGVVIGLALSLVVAIIGILLSGSYFTWFTDDLSIISDGKIYVQIVTAFAVFRILGHTGSSSLQGSGEMIKPMVAQLIGAIGNIILDPILIFGWFGMPALGVKGAAIATITAQLFSMLYIWSVIARGKQEIRLDMKRFRFSTVTIKSIVAVGVPSAIMQGLGSVMLGGLNLILAQFGESALAVMGVYFKLQSLVYMPIFGLAVGTMPVVGFNFGAKNIRRMIAAVRFSTVLAVGFMSLWLVLFQLFPRQLLSIFNATPDMYSIGIDAMRIASVMFPMVAITIILSTSFNAIGKAHFSLAISSVRQLVILLPVAYLLAKSIGVNGVWFSLVLSECVGVTLTVIIFTKVYRKIKASNEELKRGLSV